MAAVNPLLSIIATGHIPVRRKSVERERGVRTDVHLLPHGTARSASKKTSRLFGTVSFLFVADENQTPKSAGLNYTVRKNEAGNSFWGDGEMTRRQEMTRELLMASDCPCP